MAEEARVKGRKGQIPQTFEPGAAEGPKHPAVEHIKSIPSVVFFFLPTGGLTYSNIRAFPFFPSFTGPGTVMCSVKSFP